MAGPELISGGVLDTVQLGLLGSVFSTVFASGRLINGGLSDKTASGDDVIRLEKMLAPVLNKNIDTWVLGCTHFPALYKTVKKIAKPYGVRRVIDSARVGAELLNKESRKLNKKNKRAVRKHGKGDIKWQTTDAEESMTR